MIKPSINQFDTDNPELLDSKELSDSIERDFGTAMEGHADGFSRRRWLQLMGASLALGGAVGCRYEEEQIAPFAFRPQTRIPGVPQKYATVVELGGVAQPLLATNYDGRPIKLDGNPKHPDSNGASTTFTQALLLDFYCPDRLRVGMQLSDNRELAFEDIISQCKFSDYSKVAVLAQPSASPTMLKLQKEFQSRGGNWFNFAPINEDNTRAGSKLAFGKVLRSHFHFDKAKVIVTIDADPYGSVTPGVLRNKIAFAKGRDADNGKMSRIYTIESQFSTTGTVADHRLSVPSTKIEGFVAALAKAIKDGVSSTDTFRDKFVSVLAKDILAAKDDPADHGLSHSILVCGERQPPEVHAAVHALNEFLGNHGKTITFTEVHDPDQTPCLDSIKEFAAEAGKMSTVVILGGNPVFDAPRSLKLGKVLEGVETTLHVTNFKNETTLACKYASAAAHQLESWRDGYSYSGSVLVGQPLINPLFGGYSDTETLAKLMGIEKSAQEMVQETVGLAGPAWKAAIHYGFEYEEERLQDESGNEIRKVKKAPEVVPSVGNVADLKSDDGWKKWDGESLEVCFNPSNSVYDGRFVNNAWLQELPDFFTKVTWDNVVSVSPKTAEYLGVMQYGMSAKSKATMMSVSIDGESVAIPVVIQPGQADGSIGIEIGYGRKMAGRVGGDQARGVDPVGQDVGPIRPADNWLVRKITKADANKTGTLYRLAVVQEPWEIDSTGRDEIQGRMFRDYGMSESDRSPLIREGTFKSYQGFLERHPLEDGQAARLPEAKPAGLKPGELPIIQPVSYTVPDDKKPHDEKDHDESGHDKKEHGGDHAHGDEHGGHGGHEAKWPEAFHMHHELFDLEPGSRLDYTAEKANPANVHAWGMSIDLSKCVGCNACVVACQAENNIPVVGKDDVWRGREMHWMRIDRYYGDNLYAADKEEAEEMGVQVAFQPVSCHHCENAPCETVCPVAATVHTHEGLNSMVYNRCIGTRYCGNNCPYKVRRFNFFNYSDAVTLLKYPGADKLPEGDRQLQNLMMNPEVTIRSRGVMEKCTYCVQRIQAIKIKAKNENRPLRPNEMQAACQDVCGTNAITFGDLNNPESDVAKAHANPRAYGMLEELNNRPRTKYLARVRNPHPDLVSRDDTDSIGDHGGHGDDHHDDHGHEEKGHNDHSQTEHDDARGHDHDNHAKQHADDKKSGDGHGENHATENKSKSDHDHGHEDKKDH
ncbi:MAG: 4Fe-4S dicluster domain-containing protein [Planctomycetota bacterium]